MSRTQFPRLLVALVVGLLAFAAGCAEDDEPTGDEASDDDGDVVDADEEEEPDAPDDGEEQDDPADASELTEVRVGVLPLAHAAPLYVAIEDGLFAEEGLEVEPEIVQGGAAVVSAVVANELEFGYSAYTSFLQAEEEGIEVRIVAENDRAAQDHAVYVMDDSAIEEPADLAGATVSVSTLASLGPLGISAVVEEDGADPDDVTFTEVPFPEAAGALERGDVDAAWLVEPFVTQAEATIDARPLLDPFSGPTENLPTAGYGTTSEFAGENAETVEAFQRALQAGMAVLRDDGDRLAEIVPTYTEIDEEVAEQLAPPDFPEETEAEAVQQVADLMERYGLLEESIDVEPLVLEH